MYLFLFRKLTSESSRKEDSDSSKTPVSGTNKQVLFSFIFLGMKFWVALAAVQMSKSITFYVFQY